MGDAVALCAELLRNVEQTCEVNSVVAMTSSAAYQVLCEMLQRARLNADRDLQAIDREQEDPAFLAIVRSVRLLLVAVYLPVSHLIG